MSNLPLGAEEDSRAPFNLNEEFYHFDCHIRGFLLQEFEGEINMQSQEDREKLLKERFKSYMSLPGDMDVDSIEISSN